MSFQPLFQTDEGGKTILTLVKDRLLPAVSNFEKLAVDVADYRLTFWKSVFRRKLKLLENNFSKQSKDFLALYHLYSTPDDLFTDYSEKSKNNNQFTAKLVGDYFSSKQPIEKTFSEGFKLMEIIDRQLIRYSQSADQRVASVFSIIAIAISLISIYFK